MSTNEDSDQERFECMSGDCTRMFETEKGAQTHYGLVHTPEIREDEIISSYREGNTQQEVANQFGIGRSVVRRVLRQNDVETRGRAYYASRRAASTPATFRVDKDGYEMWEDAKSGGVLVHRLLAVSEYGFKDVKNKHVHHGPAEIPWLNIPSNIQVLDPAEHANHHNECIPEDNLLAELRSVADELGSTPTSAEMNALGGYDVKTYQKRFGSWNSALEMAELEPILSKPTDEDLLRSLENLADRVGRTPTTRDMDEHGEYSSSVYQSHFETWNSALERAGLKPNHREDISDEEILGSIRQLAETLGREPTKAEMADRGEFSATLCQDRFGAWSTAKEAALAESNNEQQTLDNI